MSDETVPDPEKFLEFLKRKGLAKRTVKEYMSYHQIVDGLEMNQDLINEFVIHKRTSNLMARAFLRNYLEFLNRYDLIQRIPRRTGRVPKKIPKYLEKNEVEMLINGANRFRDRVMVALAFDGGLRCDEIIKMRPIDINAETWDPTEIKIKGKGKKERVVMISPSAMEYLFHYMKVTGLEVRDKRLLFPISGDRFHDALTKLSRRILNKNVNPHQLRHSCASYLREKGWDIIDIKEYLGHESVATTQMYAHIKPVKLKEKFRAAFASE